MKTPEEIKKGLEICSLMRPCHRLTCKDCPYDEECRKMCDKEDVVPGSILMKDALAYIHDLETAHRTEYCEEADYDCIELGKARKRIADLETQIRQIDVQRVADESCASCAHADTFPVR